MKTPDIAREFVRLQAEVGDVDTLREAKVSGLQAVVLMKAIHAEFQRASARDACTASCGTEAIALG